MVLLGLEEESHYCFCAPVVANYKRGNLETEWGLSGSTRF